MRSRHLALLFLAAATLVGSPAEAQRGTSRAAASAQAVSIPDIAYEKIVLSNGLTVLVHEDRKAPIVAVNVWYHVGSKNEKPGRTGFAHLFEHLMFNGSENYNHDYFKALEPLGATDLNGTTNSDRTNYFQNVPTSALDVVLFLESDRMGHLLGAIDQARLDEQRGVVQNEKRQGENQPYGQVFTYIAEHTYPAGHPYSWTVIGSMEDLDAAEVDDVHEWFRTYYGPNNAVIVLAGDIDTATARAKVEKYFGHIPPGPPVVKQQSFIAKMTGVRRHQMQDRVPQARVYKVWNVPEWGTPERDYLSLAAYVLGSGKSSRLYKRLVYDEQIATDIAAFTFSRQLGSQFIVWATVKPGGDVAEVERAMDEEIARFLREGPRADELARARSQLLASFVRGSERIGGFGGKSDILATNQVYAGDPSFYRTTIERQQSATAEQVKRTAVEWLSDGVYVLEVHPFPQLRALASGVDRSALPVPPEPPSPEFPDYTSATLSNGMRVVLASRYSVPVVGLNLIVDAGYASDQHSVPGTARLALDMLDEGTRTRNALQISERLQLLGATLSTGSNLDVSTVSMTALRDNLDGSLELFADVILNPSFPANELDRLKKDQIAAIQREKVTPFSMALRVFPRLLYGEGHAYGAGLTGSGMEADVSAMTRDDMVRFHQTWFKPNNATLVVVGATTMDEIRPRLERLFRDWRPAEIPAKNISQVAHRASQEVYLIDRPGSQQSIIFAGHIAPPKGTDSDIAIGTFNDILGGTFNSRVNMNLREDKGWSYGARSIILAARGQQPFIVYAPVQTDKTKESVQEIVKELRGVISDMPVTAEEKERVQLSMTRRLPGRWETNSAVSGSLAEIIQFGLPPDYYDTYPGKVKALTLADLNTTARELIHPDRLVWVIVGDRSKIEAGIRELNLGPVQLLDADGRPIMQAMGEDN